MDERILKNEERAVFALRSLYRKYGYTPYKMSKFEEYEYYIRNKDFLSNDRFITFTDTNGKLLALKPDVTLSIVKNMDCQPGCKQKVFYNESIYRISETTGQFRELTQTGLECIGDIDLYDIFETLCLAAESLNLISENFVLQISHLGILGAILDAISDDRDFQTQAIACISCKNSHDLKRLCRKYSISSEDSERLCRFVDMNGSRETVLPALEGLLQDRAGKYLQELISLSRLLDGLPYSDKILFDFSVVNNMSYYNGIVFTGFVKGVSGSILAGGQYGKLMEKLNRKLDAIGFAVYLDLLERLHQRTGNYDVDVLVLYSRNTPLEEIADTVRRIQSEGRTATAQKAIPEKLRWREMIEL